MQLPPKRFDQIGNPKYDSIRHKPWFGRLNRRKAKLNYMPLAKRLMQDGHTQQEAANLCALEVREFRDYLRFADGTPKPKTPTDQAMLDNAYRIYCAREGEDNFQRCIHDAASLWGRNGRPLEELWETDPTFYPTGYTQ